MDSSADVVASEVEAEVQVDEASVKFVTVAEWKQSIKKLDQMDEKLVKLLHLMTLNQVAVPPAFIRADSVGTLSSMYTSGSSSSLPPTPGTPLGKPSAIKFQEESEAEDEEYKRTFSLDDFNRLIDDNALFLNDLKIKFNSLWKLR